MLISIIQTHGDIFEGFELFEIQLHRFDGITQHDADSRTLFLTACRYGHFRISNLPNPNPGNVGPESGSFIGLLSPEMFFAIIHCCVIVDAYCSS